MSTRPWPENAWPTAEQWLPWFLSLDSAEQTKATERMLHAMQRSAHCFEANHDGLLEELNHFRDGFTKEYQRGWNDGLQAFLEGYEAECAKRDAEASDVQA